MAKQTGFASRNRHHIVLVPGFGGFDALGQVEYYAGVTTLFRKWRGPNPVVLHYFDNLPTAAVETRATRLRAYLAKRIARGEILDTDKVVLVGHSTGALDIRRLICDLHNRDNDPPPVDGGQPVASRKIRDCLDGVVFLSAPHWGTNLADWVRSHPGWRSIVVAKLRAAVSVSQMNPLGPIEAGLAGIAAALTNAELLLALQDAMTEANEYYGKPGPSRTADAEEAASELTLYFRQISSDFHAINDLACRAKEPRDNSPAHFNEAERRQELDHWQNPPIRALSYATFGGRPFRFPSGRPAPIWELTDPCSYPEMAKDIKLSAGTDLSYRLGYRACAGGPFRWPALAGEVTRVLGPAPPEPIELWDNDGVVNTASMLWPQGETVLVLADHLDIVGHYRLVKAVPQNGLDGHYEPARIYQAYDALQSVPKFSEEMFEKVWTEIFDFTINPEHFAQSKGTRSKRVRAGRRRPVSA